MWLRLDACGLILNLYITGYKKTANEEWESSWCDIDIGITAGK